MLGKPVQYFTGYSKRGASYSPRQEAREQQESYPGTRKVSPRVLSAGLLLVGNGVQALETQRSVRGAV